MASSKIPISTYGTHLMYKATDEGTWEVLVKIKNYPDLQDAPNMLSTQTMSDKSETQILGTRKASSKEFMANYILDDYKKIEGLSGKEVALAVWFGADESGKPDGHDGKFEGRGLFSGIVVGKGVDDVQEMKIVVAMTQPFDKVAAQ